MGFHPGRNWAFVLDNWGWFSRFVRLIGGTGRRPNSIFFYLWYFNRGFVVLCCCIGGWRGPDFVGFGYWRWCLFFWTIIFRNFSLPGLLHGARLSDAVGLDRPSKCVSVGCSGWGGDGCFGLYNLGWGCAFGDLEGFGHGRVLSRVFRESLKLCDSIFDAHLLN